MRPQEDASFELRPSLKEKINEQQFSSSEDLMTIIIKKWLYKYEILQLA